MRVKVYAEFSEQDAKLLDGIAQFKGISKSDILRTALAMYFDTVPNEIKHRIKKGELNGGL